jgi:hypothetical protein
VATISDALAKFATELQNQSMEIRKQSMEIEKQGMEIGKQSMEIEKQGMEIGKQGMEIGKQGTEIGKQSKELIKQSRKLEFVTKEVVIQHRMRMDIWTESNRSKQEQQAFKESLIPFYVCQHHSNPHLLRCMVLNDFFPRHLVIGSHIWKSCTHGDGLEEFGLQVNDLINPRNGILMCKEIEQAFDTKKLCFLVDRINTNNLVLKVLDPVLLSPSTSPFVIEGNSQLRFCDIDGYSLHHPVNRIPFRRILDFHAKRSYQKAINRGWLAASSTFDDFFDMSIGASIPDLNIYDDVED